MIPSSRLAGFCAVLVALGVTISVAMSFAASRTEVAIEGTSGGSDIRLGTGFADLAAGAVPVLAEVATPTSPTETAVQAVVMTASVVPEVAPTAAKTLTPSLAAVQAESRVAPSQSVRPMPRPTAQIAPEQPRTPTPSGNAAHNETAGQSTGQAQARSITTGSNGDAQTAGNQAASNYPGLVMRYLSRVSRPRVRSPGTALVAFTIGSGGEVVSVALDASSGSAELDQAAIRLVEGAEPFPAPPVGATRSFTVQIKGR